LPLLLLLSQHHVLFTLVDLISQAEELLLAVAVDAGLVYSDHTVYLQQTAPAKYGTSERNNMFVYADTILVHTPLAY